MKTANAFRLTTLLLVAFINTSVIAGSWQNNQTMGGFNRVHIYTPDTVSAVGEGRALLVVLHGCTQSIDAYLTANLEAAAEAYGMVIAVPDAMNKAGFSCWSYWQGTRSRTAGDYQNLIALAQEMKGDPVYNIDGNQVYIAGLSSGASFANTTACIAPDVFAGMGISAGPSVGTSSSGAIGTCETANVAARCTQYAGSYASEFSTQIASIAHGDADTTVSTCYNEQNAQGMAQVYGVTQIPGSETVSEGSATAEEFLWQNGRVSMLWLHGVDHAWSGGAGASGSYINGNGVNYAMYLGRFFAENNQRVSRNEIPLLTNISATLNGNSIVVSGKATDTDGTVEQVDVHITDSADNQYHFITNVTANGQFSLTSPALADELYYVEINATDDNGGISLTATQSVRVGPAPPDAAPVLSGVLVTVTGQCATITGQVTDVNQDLQSVTVAVAPTTVAAQVSGQSFSAEICNLSGGAHTAEVEAIDSAGLSETTNVQFTIDAGQTATLDQHISAGRLDYTNYANCYLEYATAVFTLHEQSVSAQQCRWEDDDASCAGPAQACSPAPGTDPDNGGGEEDCASYNNTNYQHKVAGRAYSTGNPYAPDYFATGSDAPMSGSTWGVTSLYSDDGSTWQIGECQ